MKAPLLTRARQSNSSDSRIVGREGPVVDWRWRGRVGSVARVGEQLDTDVGDAVDQLPATSVEVVVEPDRHHPASVSYTAYWLLVYSTNYDCSWSRAVYLTLSRVQARRLAGKSDSNMTYLVSVGTLNLNSINSRLPNHLID